MKKYLTVLCSGLMLAVSASAVNCPITGFVKTDGIVSPGEWDKAWQSENFYLFSYSDLRKKPVSTSQKLPADQTRVKVAASAEYLHVLFLCKLPANYKYQKDIGSKNEKDVHKLDSVEIFIRPNRSLEFYQFSVSIAGHRFDSRGNVSRLGTVTNDHRWNCSQWLSAVRIGKDSYTVEMALPWKIFQTDDIRVNFTRSAKGYGQNVSFLPLRGRAWAQPQNFTPLSVDMAKIRPVYADNSTMPPAVMGSNSFSPFFINATNKKQTVTGCIEINGRKHTWDFEVAPSMRIQGAMVYPITGNSGTRRFSYAVNGRTLFCGDLERFTLSGKFDLLHPVQRSDREVTGAFILPLEKDSLAGSTVSITIQQPGKRVVKLTKKYQEQLVLGKYSPGTYQAEVMLNAADGKPLFSKKFSFHVIPAPVW